MTYCKHPDDKTVDLHISRKEPLLIAISFDGEKVLMSHIDDSVEHHILLAHFEEPAQDIDRYFRIAVDGESADWTFVCPPRLPWHCRQETPYHRLLQRRDNRCFPCSGGYRVFFRYKDTEKVQEAF